MSSQKKIKSAQRVETNITEAEKPTESSSVAIPAQTDAAVVPQNPPQTPEPQANPEAVSIDLILSGIPPAQLKLANDMTGGAFNKLIHWAQVMEQEVVSHHNVLVKAGLGVASPQGAQGNPSVASANPQGFDMRNALMQMGPQLLPQIVQALGGGGGNPIGDQFMQMMMKQAVESAEMTHKLGVAVLNGTIQRIVPELASKVIPNP